MKPVLLVFAALTCTTLLAPSARSTEVDDVTTYHEPLADSEAVINAHAEEIIADLLAKNPPCDMERFAKRAGVALKGNVIFGVLEKFANDSSLVQKHRIPVRQSIYRGTPFEPSVVSRVMGLGPTVNVAGLRIGTDKIGHFLAMGFDLFHRYQWTRSIESLVEQSRWEEEGFWGGISTGVISLGDVAANLDGFLFWSDFLGQSRNPFFACDDGRLRQIRPFRLSDYVTAAWSEAINCSDYSSADYMSVMEKTLQGLEAAQGKRFHCPVEPARCEGLRERYARWIPAKQVDLVVSPRCRP